MEKFYNYEDFMNFLVASFRCATKMDDQSGETFLEEQMSILFERRGCFTVGKSNDLIVLNFSFEYECINIVFKFCYFLEEEKVKKLFNAYCSIILDDDEIIEEA